ncbi:ParB N-terminal domain-containing protein [Candidatus Pacebacteria bacterium]|nr:ParB N-terminal domain-containing protein [Candidatus Paceibacterota bacterium]
MADGNTVLEQAVLVENIGLNIKTCLDLMGQPYSWLASQTMVPAPVMFNYAEGEGRIDEARITKIANALNLPEEVLTHDFSDNDRVDVIRKALNNEPYTLEVDDLEAIGTKSTVGILQPGDPPPEWWKDGGSGRVPLWALAPDPEQPRQHMDGDELAALAESVRQRGVRQAITITPLYAVPWAKYDRESYPNAQFLIVSGHRRTEAGLMAGVPDAPADVVLYASQTDHWLDGSLLNGLRAELTPIEQGYELQRLRGSVTLDRLAKIMGRSAPWVVERLALTRLDPWIQKYRLHPSHVDQSAARLTLKVAAKLGSLRPPDLNTARIIAAKLKQPLDPSWTLDDDSTRFHLQRLLLGEIEREDMGSVSACDYIDRMIENRSLTRGDVKAPQVIRRAKEPRKMRERIKNTLRGMSEASIYAWEESDFEHAFEGITDEQVRGYLEDAKAAKEELETMIERLERKLS